jgi:hypothetical protein
LDKDREADTSAQAQYGSSTLDVELIPMIDGFAVSRKQAVLPCYMFPTLVQNDNFVGRDDILEQLDKILLPSDRALASAEAASAETMKYAALCGIGGLGKTEVALQFVFTRKEKFDAIFWIRAESTEKLENDFSQITLALGLEDANETRNQVVSRELAKGWLSNPTKILDTDLDTIGQREASWLIVFDNADDPDILTNYVQIFGSGSLLVTSRSPLAKNLFLPTTESIDLEPLDSKDGALLLGRLTRKRSEEGIALQVADRLGGLPLAITQMAGIIRRQYLTYREFLDRYEEPAGQKELHVMELEPRRKTARGSIASIWAFDTLGPQAKSVLEVLIFLDPDSIQERLLLEDHAGLLSVPDFPKTKGEFFAARAELIQSSLIKRNEETREWWIHRVLQDALRANINTAKFVDIFKITVSALKKAWPVASLNQRHGIIRWKQCQEMYPHILRLRDLYHENEVLRNIDNHIEFATLLSEAGWSVRSSRNKTGSNAVKTY